MNPFLLAGGLLFYVVATRLALRRLAGLPRELALAVCNLTGVWWFLFHLSEDRSGNFRFAVYVVLVGIQYVMLRQFAGRKGWLPWLAFAAPLVVLVLVHYVPLSLFLTGLKHLGVGRGWQANRSYLLLAGLSYLAFRCSRVALEIRNGAAAMPGFWEYLNFAFFLPTMPVGPINTYANYRRGFAAEPWTVPAGRAALRILVGLVKYEFIGAILNQLTYGGFLLNEHDHHWVDLPVAMVFYFLYLYCNFSGFCDMAIGTAGLIGIPVPENFENPLAARNMREFWNRWHITLSQWMRDMVYAPLSKYLVGWFGPSRANHAIAVTIALVFLLIGVWHGVGWNYAAFGLAQSLGVVAVHYYTIFLKKRLGRDGFKAYNENRWIHAVAVVMTFCYYAATLFLFANTLPQMTEIFRILR